MNKVNDLDLVEEKYPMIVVDWKDHTGEGGWVDNVKDCDFEIARSVGWLIEDNDEVVKVANSLTKDSGVGGISVILKSCIISMWEVDFSYFNDES